MPRIFLWLAIGALLPASGCATTTAPGRSPAAPSPPRDAQSTVEPRSEAGVGQGFLARMAGEWDVVKTFYPRGGSEPTVTRGECAQKMIHAGKFLESDFIFHDPEGASDGMGIIGFDAQTGLFTSMWTDSRSTRVSLRQSESPFDGRTIVLYSKTVGAPGPDARRSRTVSTLEDGDRRLVHRQFAINADGSERPVMTLEMTRKR